MHHGYVASCQSDGNQVVHSPLVRTGFPASALHRPPLSVYAFIRVVFFPVFKSSWKLPAQQFMKDSKKHTQGHEFPPIAPGSSCHPGAAWGMGEKPLAVWMAALAGDPRRVAVPALFLGGEPSPHDPPPAPVCVWAPRGGLTRHHCRPRTSGEACPAHPTLLCNNIPVTVVPWGLPWPPKRPCLPPALGCL